MLRSIFLAEPDSDRQLGLTRGAAAHELIAGERLQGLLKSENLGVLTPEELHLLGREGHGLGEVHGLGSSVLLEHNAGVLPFREGLDEGVAQLELKVERGEGSANESISALRGGGVVAGRENGIHGLSRRLVATGDDEDVAHGLHGVDGGGEGGDDGTVAVGIVAGEDVGRTVGGFDNEMAAMAGDIGVGVVHAEQDVTLLEGVGQLLGGWDGTEFSVVGDEVDEVVELSVGRERRCAMDAFHFFKIRN